MRIYDLVKFYKYPTTLEIEQICEDYDYNNYFPTSIFLDLLTLTISSKLNLKLKINESVSNYKLKHEFFNSLDLFLFRNDSPINQVMKIIIYLNKLYDLRSLEVNGVALAGNHLNLVEDLDDESIQEFLTIMPDDVNKADASKILKLSVFLLNSSKEFFFKKEFHQLKSISDIFKLRKSKWIYPNFIEKVVKKEYFIYDEVKSSAQDDYIVYLEDNSFSMKNSLNLILAARYALLLSNKQIHFYTFDYDLNELIILKNKQEILDYFKKPVNFKQGDCNYYNIFSKVSKLYNSGSAILVTDAENFIPVSLNIKIKINCVTNVNNLTMQQLINSTKGKYIKI
jgi:hypothetical protein